MDWHIVQAHWSDYRDEIRAKWPKLTHQDLNMIHGDRTALVSEIAKRYGISPDEALEQLYDFESTLVAVNDTPEERKKTMTEAAVIANVMKP